MFRFVRPPSPVCRRAQVLAGKLDLCQSVMEERVLRCFDEEALASTSCHVPLHFDGIMVNRNLERHVTTEVFQSKLPHHLLMETCTTIPTAFKVHNGFTDIVCTNIRNALFYPIGSLNGPAHSLSDSACGIALGLCDKAYNAFRACSNDDEIWTMRHWIEHVYSDHSENPIVCGCSIDLRIPTVVEE